MRHLLAVALVVASEPAVAQSDYFFVEEAGWSVMEFPGGSCLAENRPAEEFNFAPYNALALHRAADDETPRLQVFFWPGIVTAGEESRIKVAPRPGRAFEVSGKAVSDFHFETNDPMTTEQLEALARADSVEVHASAAGHTLLFRATPIARVLELIEECAK